MFAIRSKTMTDKKGHVGSWFPIAIAEVPTQGVKWLGLPILGFQEPSWEANGSENAHHIQHFRSLEHLNYYFRYGAPSFGMLGKSAASNTSSGLYL